MRRRSRSRGSGLLELLVGAALALVVLGALTAAVASGARLLVATGARGEAEDTIQLAVEALTFDARRAGFDPALGRIAALTEALADRLTFTADLDGNGVVDTASEETTAYVCRAGRLSRLIGRQSLPLADGLSRCAFSYYLDGAGVPVPVPPGGLDAATRARVRAVALDLTLLAPRLHGPTLRRALVALRTAS